MQSSIRCRTSLFKHSSIRFGFSSSTSDRRPTRPHITVRRGDGHPRHNDSCVVYGARANIPFQKRNDLLDLLTLNHQGDIALNLTGLKGALIRTVCCRPLCVGDQFPRDFSFAGRSCLPTYRKDKMEMPRLVEDAKLCPVSG